MTSLVQVFEPVAYAHVCYPTLKHWAAKQLANLAAEPAVLGALQAFHIFLSSRPA